MSKRYRDGLLAAAQLVPENWLDPMLSGPKALVSLERNNIDVIGAVELVLNAVRERIEAAAREAAKPKKKIERASSAPVRATARTVRSRRSSRAGARTAKQGGRGG